MLIVNGDGVVTFANIIPGVIVGLAGGKSAGGVNVGVGTNNICHVVSVGVPLTHPKAADVVVIPDTGHFPQLDNPDVTSQIMLDFLADLRQPSIGE